VFPIGSAIGSFIGVYLTTQSIGQALSGALGTLIAGIVISFLMYKKKKKHSYTIGRKKGITKSI